MAVDVGVVADGCRLWSGGGGSWKMASGDCVLSY